MKRVILFMLLFLACKTENLPQSIIVIDVYQEESRVIIGAVEKDWRTVVEFENGSRTNVWGKLGSIGDTIENMIVSNCNGGSGVSVFPYIDK